MRAQGFDFYVDDFRRDGNNKLIVPKLEDLRKTSKYPIDFVIAQIYQGGYWSDFPLLWENICAPCGIRGEYVYQRSGLSWLKQAEEVLAHTPADCQMMLLDVEKGGNVVDATMMADASRILRYWQDNKPAGVKKIAYYANPDMYVSFILPIMLNHYPLDKWYLEFDLWVSQWPFLSALRSPENNPSLPKGMRADWKLYQWTDAGGTVPLEDQNVFNGPVEDMRKWLGLDAPAPVPAPVPVDNNHLLEILTKSDQGASVPFHSDLQFTPPDIRYVAIDSHQFTEPLPTPQPTPTPEPAPSPEPVPIPQVVDDIRYGIIKTEVLPPTAAGIFTPAVARMNDHPVPDDRKGNDIPITDAERAFVVSINPTEKGAWYVNDTVGSMIINSPGRAVSIGCQHNFASWLKGTDRNNCHNLRCFQGDDHFHDFAGSVTFDTRPDIIFKCMSVNADGVFNKVNKGIDAYAPLMACAKSQGGTGELWKNTDSIEEFPVLPQTVTITADPNLRIHDTFMLDSPVSGFYEKGEQVIVYEYRPRGTSVWARADKGWICLLLNGIYMTSWHLNTPTVF